MSVSRSVAAGFCCLLFCPVTQAAQEVATVTGVVTAVNAVPLARARVTISGTPLAAATDSSGIFRVAGVPAGTRTLEVKMLGYAPLKLAIEVLAGETLHIRLPLSATAAVKSSVELAAVTITGDAGFSPGMGGFEERRGRGAGRFFTRDEIARMQPRQVTDVLRRVPGMQIQQGGGVFSGGSQTAQSGRSVGSSVSRVCPVAYYVNGAAFPLPNDVPINHYLTPDDIVGIEVYTGASQIPAQFGATMNTSRCGLVVIWTRSGIDTRVSR